MSDRPIDSFRLGLSADFILAAIAWGSFAILIPLAAWLHSPEVFLLGWIVMSAVLLVVARHMRLARSKLLLQPTSETARSAVGNQSGETW